MTQEEHDSTAVGRRIKEAQVAVRVRMEELLHPFDLSAAQYAALDLIDRVPGSSNAQLAREAFVTRQSMNTMLQSLAKRGLIARAERATSGRELPTALTNEGSALLRGARNAVLDMEQQATASFTSRERERLLADLDRIIAALQSR